MNTCTVCHGDNTHEDSYCVYCGSLLATVRDTESLGSTIESAALRSLYYRAGQGLWFKLTSISHVAVELGPLGIIGRSEPEDFDGTEIVQPYRSTR